MKRKWFPILQNVILYLALAITAAAAIGTAILKKPFLMTSVFSNSMYPEFQRGDLLFIQNLSPTATLSQGDIIVFKVQDEENASKSWVVHRLIGGDEINGFITKGDANEYSDQDHGFSARILREWVVGRVVLLGNHVVKIPFIGYLSVWMEEFQKSPLLIPGIIVILALVIGTSGRSRKSKGGKKKEAGAALLYFLGGLVLSAMLSVSMIAISQHITVVYDVSSKGKGVIQGSEVGILMVGDKIEKQLAEVRNKGFFPVIVTVTADDRQFELSHQQFVMRPGDSAQVAVHIRADREGAYRSDVHVGMFYPFLPMGLVHTLASAHYGLAVAAIALVPGLPIMVFPLFDTKMRRAIVRQARHGWMKLKCGTN